MENLTIVQHHNISLEAKIGKKTGLEVVLKLRANDFLELGETLDHLSNTLPTRLAILKQKLEALEVKNNAES